mgnify:FL=1
MQHFKISSRYTAKQSIMRWLMKVIVIAFILMIAIFLIEKINFPSPEKNFNQDITNEIIKLK